AHRVRIGPAGTPDIRRQKLAFEPAPERRERPAREATLLLGALARGREQVLDRLEEGPLQGGNAMALEAGPLEGRPQSFENGIMGQETAIEPVILDGDSELARDLIREHGKKSLKLLDFILVHCRVRTLPHARSKACERKSDRSISSLAPLCLTH